MKYKVAIFDLDGTILDTIGDLAAAVNYALALRGYPTHTVDAVRRMVGNGVANLIRRCVPAGTPDSVSDAVLADFKAYYREHVNDTTRPYDGIASLFAELRAAGVYVGINSNKYDTALQSLCRIHFSGLYDYAVGESEVTPRKPDPTAALRIIEAAGANKSEAVYIGDSSVDLDTARNACIDAIWVSWGFRTREEMSGTEIPVSFDSVDALRGYLLI